MRCELQRVGWWLPRTGLGDWRRLFWLRLRRRPSLPNDSKANGPHGPAAGKRAATALPACLPPYHIKQDAFSSEEPAILNIQRHPPPQSLAQIG